MKMVEVGGKWYNIEDITRFEIKPQVCCEGEPQLYFVCAILKGEKEAMVDGLRGYATIALAKAAMFNYLQEDEL